MKVKRNRNANRKNPVSQFGQMWLKLTASPESWEQPNLFPQDQGEKARRIHNLKYGRIAIRKIKESL
jgi:hypothetical protein